MKTPTSNSTNEREALAPPEDKDGDAASDDAVPQRPQPASTMNRLDPPGIYNGDYVAPMPSLQVDDASYSIPSPGEDDRASHNRLTVVRSRPRRRENIESADNNSNNSNNNNNNNKERHTESADNNSNNSNNNNKERHTEKNGTKDAKQNVNTADNSIIRHEDILTKSPNENNRKRGRRRHRRRRRDYTKEDGYDAFRTFLKECDRAVEKLPDAPAKNAPDQGLHLRPRSSVDDEVRYHLRNFEERIRMKVASSGNRTQVLEMGVAAESNKKEIEIFDDDDNDDSGPMLDNLAASLHQDIKILERSNEGEVETCDDDVEPIPDSLAASLTYDDSLDQRPELKFSKIEVDDDDDDVGPMPENLAASLTYDDSLGRGVELKSSKIEVDDDDDVGPMPENLAASLTYDDSLDRGAELKSSKIELDEDDDVGPMPENLAASLTYDDSLGRGAELKSSKIELDEDDDVGPMPENLAASLSYDDSLYRGGADFRQKAAIAEEAATESSQAQNSQIETILYSSSSVPPPERLAAPNTENPSTSSTPAPFYPVEATLVRNSSSTNTIYPAEPIPELPFLKKHSRGIIFAIISFFIGLIAILVSVMQSSPAEETVSPPAAPYLSGSCVEYTGALFEVDCNGCSPPVDIYGNTTVTAVKKKSLNFYSFTDYGQFENSSVFSIDYRVGGADGGVSISGNVAVVGTPEDTSYDKDSFTGTVYVYDKDSYGSSSSSDGVWNPAGRLIPRDIADAHQFGRHVDIDGDVIVVSAYDRTGSVYVYRRDVNNTWVEEAKIAPNQPLNKDFGKSAKVKGNRIVVGDRLFGYKPEGVVYLYEYNENLGNWSQLPDPIQEITCDGRFGVIVALANEHDLMVGCPFYGKKKGAVYHYTQSKDGGAYSLRQILTASDGADGNRFGGPQQISADGNVMTIGEYRNENGLAYVFVRESQESNWTEVAKINAPNSESPYFGDQIALSGTKVLISSSDNVYSYDLKECVTEHQLFN